MHSQVSDNTQNDASLSFTIEGMHCVSCAGTIQKALTRKKGVVTAAIHYPTREATVRFDPKVVDPVTLAQTIRELGYHPNLEQTVRVDAQERAQKKETQTLKTDTMMALSMVLPLMILSMGDRIGIPLPSFLVQYGLWVQFVLATLVLWVGRLFFKRGILAVIKTRSANMDTLVALGVGAAYLYSLAMSLLVGLKVISFERGHVYYETAAF